MSSHDEHLPSDAELDAAEKALREALEAAEPFSGRAPAGARAEFRDGLRSAFVDGSLAHGPDAREVLGPRLDDALRAWSVPPASDEARARIEASFLGAGVEASGRDVAPQARSGRRGATQHRTRRAGTRPSGARTSQAPGPARSQRRRLQLVAGGAGLLAAAAVLFVLVPKWTSGAADDSGGTVPNTDRVAEAPAESGGAWSIESVEGGDVPFEGLRVDGQQLAALDAGTPQSQLDGWRRLEAGPDGLRIRRGDDFVLELGPRSVVEFSEGEADLDGAGVVRIAEGELRVATGPSFTAGELVLESAHVRTRIMGTIVGLDVGEDYTCVCCYEGEVRTVPLLSGADERFIGGGSTRVVAAALGGTHPFDTLPLVPHHAGPLERLSEYWG